MRGASAKLEPQHQLLPSSGLETRPSHTDNAWSAARRTNFRLSGLMVHGWSVDASRPTASLQRDHRRAIQQQLMCRRRASTPPPAQPTKEVTSWNMTKRTSAALGRKSSPTHPPPQPLLPRPRIQLRALSPRTEGVQVGRNEQKQMCEEMRSWWWGACASHKPPRSPSPAGIRWSTLLRSTVVLWVGTMCVHDAFR